MATRETVVENEVCTYGADTYGMLSYKFTSPNAIGVPDRLFIPYNAPIFFIEFKKPDEDAKPHQVRIHEKIRARGHTVFVVDDIEEGKRIVDFIASLAITPVPA